MFLIGYCHFANIDLICLVQNTIVSVIGLRKWSDVQNVWAKCAAVSRISGIDSSFLNLCFELDSFWVKIRTI